MNAYYRECRRARLCWRCRGPSPIRTRCVACRTQDAADAVKRYWRGRARVRAYHCRACGDLGHKRTNCRRAA